MGHTSATRHSHTLHLQLQNQQNDPLLSLTKLLLRLFDDCKNHSAKTRLHVCTHQTSQTYRMPLSTWRTSSSLQQTSIIILHSHIFISTCALALSDTKATDNFYSCPYKKALAEPDIYCANCKNNGHSSTIINSLQPVTLSFYCDSEHKLNWTFTKFSSRLETGCKLNSSGKNTVALPQMTDNFLFDPQIRADLKSPKPPPSIIKFNLILIFSITFLISISLILSIPTAFFCHYKKRKVTLNQALSQNQIREL